MITISELACISGHMYNPDQKIYSHTPFFKHQQGARKAEDGWNQMTDVTSFMHPANHFYAALYIKFVNGEAKNAVIAIRGTIKDWVDIATDAISWCSDVMGDGTDAQMPILFHQAIIFEDKACEYLRKHYPEISGWNHITYTGHSLGGAIAQLLTLQGMHACRSVVFNSPGCGHIFESEGDRGFGVYNVNAKYGFINKVGETVGELFVIDVPEREKEAKQIFESFDKEEFEKSLAEYQKKQTIDAAFDRAISYLSTIDTVKAFPETKKDFLKCDNEHTLQDWIGLRNRLAKSICKTEAILGEYVNIFTAQHSIENVVSTLESEECSHIGSMFC